jgi:Vitamin K-dependent gamma-carboxylase
MQTSHDGGDPQTPGEPVKRARKKKRPAGAPSEEIAPAPRDKGVAPREDAPLPRPGVRPLPAASAIAGALWGPEPILRLEIIRIFAPLATLGFMSSRLGHADEWLTDVGFQVPRMTVPDYRQPLYLAPLSTTGAWTLAAAMVISGLLVSAGFRARAMAVVFAATLAYVALSDRLAAFTVSKLSPAVMLALAASPCGARLGVDAWLKRRRDPAVTLPRQVAAGSVRFFQLLLLVFYAGSAVAKGRGDWLHHPHVLYTHLHDSYQTVLSWTVANVFPGWTYTLLQGVVFTLEAGAPLWFAWKRTRYVALGTAVVMHALIGLMFWPVRWFSLLMITMWCGAFLPAEWLERALDRITAPGPARSAS